MVSLSDDVPGRDILFGMVPGELPRVEEDSRIMLKLAGLSYYPAFVPLMRIHDMIVDVICGTDSDDFRFRNESKPKLPSFGYSSGEELEAALARFNKN